MSKHYSAYLAFAFIVLAHSSALCQTAATVALVKSPDLQNDLNTTLGWIKTKIEKYGGKSGNLYQYTVSFSAPDCEIYIARVDVADGEKYQFTLRLNDFKEVKQSGRDIEILSTGSSVVGQINGSKSAWSGIRISQFKFAESNMVERIHEAFEKARKIASAKCQ